MKWRAEPVPEHGKAWTYAKWGCRCEPCKAANAKAGRAYYKRKKARLKAEGVNATGTKEALKGSKAPGVRHPQERVGQLQGDKAGPATHRPAFFTIIL